MKRETASMGVDVEERGTTCKSDDLSIMRVATSSYLEKIADEHGVEWKPRVPMRAYEMHEPTRAHTGDTCEPLLKQIETRWKF
jgi:hypothetical protein